MWTMWLDRNKSNEKLAMVTTPVLRKLCLSLGWVRCPSWEKYPSNGIKGR